MNRATQHTSELERLADDVRRFSLYLSLQDEADERVLLALDEMMEQTL